MFKEPQKTVQDNKSLSYPLFELPVVNYKCFREFRENNRFLKIFFIHLSWKGYPFIPAALLLNALVMVANAECIACKCFK